MKDIVLLEVMSRIPVLRFCVLGDEGQGIAVLKESDILKNFIEPFRKEK